jgi:hypothetical protein
VSDAEDEIDLSSLQHLRVQATSVPSIWRVSLPLQPWEFSSAERERQSMVGRLSAVFPYRALWLSDWASDEHARWHLLARDESLSLFDSELASGAWVLFFFDHDPGATFDTALVPMEPVNAAAVVQLLHGLGVTAAIWSWYDDNEWLVAVPADKQRQAGA